MEMNYDISEEMENYAMEGMGMHMGMNCTKYQHNIVHPRPSFFSGATGDPKRRKRTNSKVSRAASQKLLKMQDLSPPKLTGYGDTVVVSNPFDDGPSKPCQPIPTNMEANMVGQQMQLRGINDQLPRAMSPMGPSMSVPGPRMPPNMSHMMRPMVNHMISSNFQQMNQAPKNFMCLNGMPQHVQDMPLAMQHLWQIGQMANLKISTTVNQLNNTSANNHTANPPINADMKAETSERSPVNALRLSLDDDANITLAENIRKFEDDDFGDEPITVEQLMSIDVMSVEESIQMEKPISESKSPENEETMACRRRNVRPNWIIQQPNLQSVMASRQRASEKIYPGDQPVIFNCQNPHTPPIYPCGVCHREVNDNNQGIMCESGCNFWFHRQCLGLSEAAYQLLTQEIYAEWACNNCLRTKDIPMIKYKP